MKVREMTVQDAMSELRQVDKRLQEAATAFVAAKGEKDRKDALSRLRATGKAFGNAERNVRSAKMREVKAIDL